jgi:hypothetical protein
MAQENFNVSLPNDGLGDALRNAFIKQQAMNTELYESKVDKITGQGLSENNFTNLEQVKLSGIEEGAEVNVQADWNQTDDEADDFIKNKPEIGGGSFKKNIFFTTTLSDLGLTTFDELTNEIVKDWIDSLEIVENDNEIYYFEILEGGIFDETFDGTFE